MRLRASATVPKPGGKGAARVNRFDLAAGGECVRRRRGQRFQRCAARADIRPEGTRLISFANLSNGG